PLRVLRQRTERADGHPPSLHDALPIYGEAARNTLIGKGWTISGDGRSCRPFITTWQATNNTITIPTEGSGYNYEIFWEEIGNPRSEEHTSELQSRENLVCRLLLEKRKS